MERTDDADDPKWWRSREYLDTLILPQILDRQFAILKLDAIRGNRSLLGGGGYRSGRTREICGGHSLGVVLEPTEFGITFRAFVELVTFHGQELQVV